MKILPFLTLCAIGLLVSCSGDDDEMNVDFTDQIVGGWQLEEIRVEGTDCQLLFGNDVPETYNADEVGCATPEEILGNAKRCFNFELKSDGTGTFFWSAFSSSQDAPLTFDIRNDEVRYCINGTACSSYYKLVNGKLESESDLSLDQDCRAVYVLKRK